jgi:hypothetical protein
VIDAQVRDHPSLAVTLVPVRSRNASGLLMGLVRGEGKLVGRCDTKVKI